MTYHFQPPKAKKIVIWRYPLQLLSTRIINALNSQRIHCLLKRQIINEIFNCRFRKYWA
jgi:hypothetical protein